ncbi:hypothetical protein DC58_02060 [Vibrio navarrensis]|uniref:head-tail joining protein n=1 Tax=Vibrio navarrensis TaxID=29495 RepID=UPI00052E2ECB|nr:hypothetical protein [Vibrio navarrensis]KGK16729.1 hypothetical protein DC58_02060 [Vibrio navarrensis]
MFDNEFDRAMAQVDETVWSEFGVTVRINGGDEVTAIYDEGLNEFDAMTGNVSKLSFRLGDGVKPRKGDKILFVSSGRELTVTSGPYRDSGNLVVIL